MSLKIGEPAPNFTLVTKTAEGPQTVTLADHFGESNILLLFVPMAFTGVCTEELCDITKNINSYTSLDAKVFAISGDNPFAQEAWAQKENIDLPLLSDYEHDVAKAYGIAYEQFLPEANLIMGGVPKRSAFLIDKAGTIQHIDIQDHPKDLPDFEAIQTTLKNL